MKGKTTDSTKNCFSFTSGYSLSLKNTSTIPFITNDGIYVYACVGCGLPLISPIP